MAISYQSINSENKETLIKSCLNLVKKIAWHYHGRVKNIIEIDDLIQVGMLGLVTAAENFIEKPGVTFSSYARIRIKGEIIDFLGAFFSSAIRFFLASMKDTIQRITKIRTRASA